MTPDSPHPEGPTSPPPVPVSGVERWCVTAFVVAELLQNIIPISLVAWLSGLGLLAYSAIWTRREKLQAWLWLSSGFPLLVITSQLTTRWANSGEGRPGWAYLLLAGLLAYLAYQVLVVVRLLKRRG
jgi:hypothetical protein